MDWNDEKTVLKALALLYSYQTQDERVAQVTAYDNGVGFNATDAGFLSSVAEQLFVRGKGISEKQYDLVKVMLRKYENTQLRDLEYIGIDLPDTAIVYRNGHVKETGDGIILILGDELRFKPFVYPSTQIKTIGFTWAQDGSKTWTAKLDLSRVYSVMDMFPNYTLDESAEKWLAELDKPIEIEEKEVYEDLKAFQKEAVGFLLRSRRALLGLAPRLGKTPVSIIAAKELGGNVLVICPLSLMYNWRREIKRWANEDSEIWYGYLGRGEQPWIITNYETALNSMVRYDLKTAEKNGKKKKIRVNWRPVEQFMFSTVIVDESVLIKNRHAQRSEMIDTLCNKLKTVKNVFLLSGSPTTKFYDDLWKPFHILYPKRFSSYWDFAREYCALEETRWGTKIHSNLADAAVRIKRNCRDFYFARTQEQVTNMPEWDFTLLEVPMHPAQAKMYYDMETHFVAELPDGDHIVAPNILARMTRLIQFASNPVLLGGPNLAPKWDAAFDLLEFEELPAVIWTNYVDTGNLIADRLKKLDLRVGILVGQTPTHERDSVEQNFKAGKLDVVVAHPGVGKFGISLAKAKTAIYVERSYNGDDYYQSLHRVRLMDMTHSPRIIILRSIRSVVEDEETVAYPTIDHVIHEVLGFKRENSIQITTGLIREVLGGKI